MKAPYWGMFRAAIVLIAVFDVAVFLPDGRALAIDQAGAAGFGPSVAPLPRPGGDPSAPTNANGWNGYVPAPAYTPNFPVDQTGAVAPTTTGQPSNIGPTNLPPVVIATTNTGGAPPRFAADQNLPLVASGPTNSQLATPNSSVPAASSAPPAAKTGHSPWQPIQAAFRQFTDTKSDSSSPAPAADVVPSRPNVSAPGLIDPGSPVRSTARLQSIRASNMQPMPGDPTATDGINSTPGSMATPPGAALMQPGAAGLPPGFNPMQPTAIVYEGPNGPPAPGGCGCNGGGGCPNLPEGQAACPNCGGWKPCSTCTHDPAGSTILQRLACRLTRPRPDCSNGCVDFCDSWLFHENDWWATSNHKCPAAGCGPWPYGGCETDGKGKGNGCGCGNCGFCIPPPDFYFSAEAMALTRDNEAKTQDVVLGGINGTVSTDSFDFDWRVGPSFILGYRPTPKDAWEFDYFGLQDFNSNQFAMGAGSSLTLPGDLGTAGGTAFSGAIFANVAYTSLINNAEVNYFWYPGSQRWVSLLTGFRYFRLDETFDINATSEPPPPTLPTQSFYDVHSINNLYGWQIGARLKQCGDRFGYEITGKAVLYGNNVEDRQLVSNVADTPIRNVVTFQNNWAFIGQVDASVTYRISKGWQAIAGYNALWIDDVALAPDQLDFTNNPISGTTIDHYGKVFMHGGHVGLAYRW